MTDTSPDLLDKVNLMLQGQRYEALRELILGISPYSGTLSAGLMTEAEERAWQMAVTHLEFLAKFGNSVDSAAQDTRLFFAYPQEFEAWLAMGAPGALISEVEAYLAENPI